MFIMQNRLNHSNISYPLKPKLDERGADAVAAEAEAADEKEK